MREIYLGTQQDQQYIKVYLDNIRCVNPLEIATLPSPLNLSEPLLGEMVHIELFWEIVTRCLKKCYERYGIEVSQLSGDRYYVAHIPELEALGGFHDPHSLGYQYWYDAAFVATLNRLLVSKKLMTVELARSFLHDCFHRSTFKSFRRAIRLPAPSVMVAKHRVPEVYREQYGINFRNRDGLSYSSSKLTDQSPETINLNILMDGVIVLVVAELMKEVVGGTTQSINKVENELWKEIFLEPFDTLILPRAHDFWTSIIAPSQLFVEHWGGRRFIAIVLRAMVSGDLQEIKHFFEELTGTSGAWEKKFKRSNFDLLLNP